MHFITATFFAFFALASVALANEPYPPAAPYQPVHTYEGRRIVDHGRPTTPPPPPLTKSKRWHYECRGGHWVQGWNNTQVWQEQCGDWYH